MNTAELIYQEAKTLPDNLGAEVLDFIGYLKSRHPITDETPPTAEKIDKLEAVFAPYRRDLSGFRFDRDEANAR
jgi:hypothetical protein